MFWRKYRKMNDSIRTVKRKGAQMMKRDEIQLAKNA